MPSFGQQPVWYVAAEGVYALERPSELQRDCLELCQWTEQLTARMNIIGSECRVIEVNQVRDLRELACGGLV